MVSKSITQSMKRIFPFVIVGVIVIIILEIKDHNNDIFSGLSYGIFFNYNRVANINETTTPEDIKKNKSGYTGAYDDLKNTSSLWQAPKYLLPLEVRHKMMDSGEDIEHLGLLKLSQQGAPIRILFWSRMYTSTGLEYGEGRASFYNLHCPINNCEVHRDRKLLNTSDAVVFFMPVIHVYKYPEYRLPGQKWVFFGRESPRHYRYEFFGQVPNLTMTYRYSSDIAAPYGRTYPRKTDPGPVQENIAAGKTSLIAWVVSNCNAHSRRFIYTLELMKYVPVHIYGGCGNYSCENDCFKSFNKTYKFYLSFENTLCEDYVTEKSFKILQNYNMIPIVLGGANYSKMLPPKSYIDITDFQSPKHLAKHILYLNDHDDEYNKYFEWRRYYRVVRFDWHYGTLCGLCHGLHRYKNKEVIRSNFLEWWNSGCSDRAAYFRDHAPPGLAWSDKRQYTAGNVTKNVMKR